jgi:hypothetical protein
MEYSGARNHLTPLIELLPAVVALNTTMTYTINVPLFAGVRMCVGTHDKSKHSSMCVCVWEGGTSVAGRYIFVPVHTSVRDGMLKSHVCGYC